MLLTIFETAFKSCKFIIDPSTLCFYGTTDDYDYNHFNSFNCISFVLLDVESSDIIVEEIAKTFKYSNSNVNDYIKIKTVFKDYESDKRPRISILERNGSRGIKNPLSFTLTK